MHAGSFTCHAAATARARGTSRLAARAGHHDLGPGHRRRRRRRAAQDVCRGRRQPDRHRRCVRRRRRRGGHRHAARQPRAARRCADRDEGGPAPGHGAAARRFARPPAERARRVAAPARHRSRRHLAGARLRPRTRRWTRRCPRSTTRSPPAGSATSASSNFSGWQTAQAATWQTAWPGRAPIVSAQVEYSLLERGIEREVLPGLRGVRAGRAAVVAARPRRADRQIPQRPPGRLAGRVAALRAVRRARTWTRAARRSSSRCMTAADGLGVSPVEVALAWVRDRPGVVGAGPRRPYGRAAARRAADRGDHAAGARSAGRSTTCRRSGTATPSGKADAASDRFTRTSTSRTRTAGVDAARRAG